MNTPKKTHLIIQSILITIIIMIPISFGISNLYSLGQSNSIDSSTISNETIVSLLEAKKRIFEEYVNFDSIDILLHKEVIRSSTCITQAFSECDSNKKNKLICKNDSWLFVIDYYPGALFAHPVEIGIIDSVNGNFETMKAEWWPLINDKPDFFDHNRWEKIPFYRYKLSTEVHINSTTNKTSDCDCYFEKKSNSRNYTETDFVFRETAIDNELWAIIVCGSIENQNAISLSYDTNDMYTMLIAYKISPKKIFYFNPNKFQLSNDDKISPLPTSLSNIENIFEYISSNIDKNEKFLFFISTHGVTDRLTLENDTEKLVGDKLKALLAKIHCKKKFVFINACSSGSFANIDLDNTIIITTTSAGELSFDDKDNECDENQERDHGNEFISGFIEAYSKFNGNLEKREEKRISIYESFSYAEKKCIISGDKCMQMCNGRRDRNKCNNPVLVPKEAAKKAFLFWD